MKPSKEQKDSLSLEIKYLRHRSGIYAMLKGLLRILPNSMKKLVCSMIQVIFCML